MSITKANMPTTQIAVTAVPDLLVNLHVNLVFCNDVCRGFKDTRTAELFLQRARKLEHNTVQKQKFSQLGQYLKLLFLLLFSKC